MSKRVGLHVGLRYNHRVIQIWIECGWYRGTKMFRPGDCNQVTVSGAFCMMQQLAKQVSESEYF